MNPAIYIGFAPLSWCVGLVRDKSPTKMVWAFGPFRLSVHNLKGEAK